MSSYARAIARLEPRAALAGPEVSRVALLTGQSSFRTSRLSPDQERFLEAVAPAGYRPLQVGFPYHPALAGEGYRDVPLWTASWRNAAQVVWNRTPRYQRLVAEVLQALFERTGERLLLVTGSCGLDLLDGAWPWLRVPAGLEVRVVALGPVCWGRPALPRSMWRVVQGRGDWVSRAGYAGPVDIRVPGGHLDYWGSEAARRAVIAAHG